MRKRRQSASGRCPWRPSRTLFVASLILAVAVLGSIAAAAPGGTQAGDPGAWTWGQAPQASAAASGASTSSAQSGPAGTVLTGPSGSHVVVGHSAKNDTSPALSTMKIPLTPNTAKE